MDQNLYHLKGITPEEYTFVQQIMNGMDEKQKQQFIFFYSGKRQSPGDVLLFTLLGFIGVSGVQRFILGQIGMGILYFLTCGLCFVGTIVDAINHKNLANDHNQKMALESAHLVRIQMQ